MEHLLQGMMGAEELLAAIFLLPQTIKLPNGIHHPPQTRPTTEKTGIFLYLDLNLFSRHLYFCLLIGLDLYFNKFNSL